MVKVRDVIKLIEADGWHLVVPKGSHRQYKHSTKLGRVTIAGHPGHGYLLLSGILICACLKILFSVPGANHDRDDPQWSRDQVW